MSLQESRVRVLLKRHGRTFAAELGARIERNTPAPLFQLLCLSLLTSAPVPSDVAMRGAKALRFAGWTTPRKMQRSTWRGRARALNRAGYARVDEKTARQLQDLADTLQERYKGDLRRLRAEADGSPKSARRALKRFKGIGDTGAGIFLREAQAAWPELYPYADKAALAAAGDLNLPTEPVRLSRLVPQKRFPMLVAALVRTRLNRDTQNVREAAG